MELSKYNPNAACEIVQLFRKAFSDSEGRSEGELIASLVKEMMATTDSKDLYCFVATENEQIIAGVFFTKMIFENDINAFILSPMATLTEYQGKGVGQKLINYGLETLKTDGVELLLTYGDPNFYSKAGFEVVAEQTVPSPLKLSFPEGWLAQSLLGDEVEAMVVGKPHCVEALNNPDLW